MMLRCLNMSEFAIIDRVLNMSHTMHSARSLYKLMNTYWEIGVFRTLSKIKECFGKLFSVLTIFAKLSILYERVLNTCWVLNMSGSWVFQIFNMVMFWISTVTQGLPIFVNMAGFWICAWIQLWKVYEYSRISNMAGCSICKDYRRFWICLNAAK